VTSFRQFRSELALGTVPARIDPVPDAARLVQGQRAGFPSRFTAAVIDVAIITVVTLALYGSLAVAEFLLYPGVTIYKPDPVPFFFIGYGLMWLYWTVAWARGGRTVGNGILGIRVRSRRGGQLGWGTAALRSLLSLVLPFGIFWVVVSKQNRSLQDLILRSNVVYAWK
jgi:uncharacterized RDD family membrane protein YckC